MNQPGRLNLHVPPIDMRGGDEIESELDEEFAFHLEQSARDLRNEGRSSTEAQHEARARFGDIETIKRDCKRIAMKERIMLQRINLALMIVVLIVVGLVSMQMFTTQKYNTLALQAITADLAQIGVDAAVARNTGAGAGAETATPSQTGVRVVGDVEHPGWYPITLDGATYLHEVLHRAGVKEQMWFRLISTPERFTSLMLTDLYLGDDPVREVLKPGQEFVVYKSIPDSDLRRNTNKRALSGVWREVALNAGDEDSSRSLTIDDPLRDVRRYETVELAPWGVMETGDGHSIALRFCTSRAFIFDATRSRALGTASWSYEDRTESGHLLIKLWRDRNEEEEDWIEFARVETEEGAEDAADGNAVEDDDGAGAGAGAGTATPTQASVLVQGDVERPGWYPITLDGATYLHEVLQRAGVKEQMWFDGDGFALSLTDHYLADDPVLQVLKPGQEIRVYDGIPIRYRTAPRSSLTSFLSSGLWREVNVDGELLPNGRLLTVPQAGANVLLPVCGELRHSSKGDVRAVEFCDSSTAFMFDKTQSRAFGVAKWGPHPLGDDWLLVMNPSPTRSESAWIYFEHVASQTEEGDAENQPVTSLTIYGSIDGAGKYPFPESGELSVAEAIVMAGGPADAASTVEVKRERDGETQIVFSAKFGTAGEMARLDFSLQPDDRVYLEPAYGYVPDEQPSVVGKVYLDGAVAHIGVYDLYSGKGKTLLELLLEAGGVTQTPARVQVIRHNDQSEQIVVIDEVIEDIRQIAAAETLLLFEDHVVVSAVDTDDGG